MSHPIRRLATLQSDVFLLNSHPGLFTVAITAYAAEASRIRHPFSRSYGVILPSSLRRILSSTLPYSGYLPVSDSGTIDHNTPSMVFLGSMVSATSLALSIELPVSSQAALRQPYGLRRRHPTLRLHSLPRHIEVITLVVSAGILTCCPSLTPFGLSLGSTNPGRINLPQET